MSVLINRLWYCHPSIHVCAFVCVCLKADRFSVFCVFLSFFIFLFKRTLKSTSSRCWGRLRRQWRSRDTFNWRRPISKHNGHVALACRSRAAGGIELLLSPKGVVLMKSASPGLARDRWAAARPQDANGSHGAFNGRKSLAAHSEWFALDEWIFESVCH